MMGRDHALSGMVAWAALAPQLPATGVSLVTGLVLCGGAGVLPDLDHRESTIASEFGFVTGTISRIVEKISGGHRHATHSFAGVAVFTAYAWWASRYQAEGGHSWGWHMFPAGFQMALLFAAVLRAAGSLQFIPEGAGKLLAGHTGDLAGLAAAALTLHTGADLAAYTPWHVPMLALAVAAGCLAHIAGDECTHGGCPLFWPVHHECHLLPHEMEIPTGRWFETRVVSLVLIAALAYLLVWRDTAAGAYLARLPELSREEVLHLARDNQGR